MRLFIFILAIFGLFSSNDVIKGMSLAIISLHFLNSMLYRVMVSNAIKNVPCKVHKWSYDKNTGDIVCGICNKTPSKILSEIQ